VFLGILDLSTGEVTYTNAGHNPQYLKRADGELVRLDRRHGPVIGAVEGLAYGQDGATLAPGDVLFLYTDGVTEAMNEDEQLYGEERLRTLLSTRQFTSVEELVNVGVDDVWEFQGDAEQADDVTVMAVSYPGRSVETRSATLELTVNNRVEEIDRVNERFNGFARQHGVPEADRRRLNLVFDELLNNIISYAYEDDGEHTIEIAVSLVNERLVVSLTDDGRAFNPLGQETPDTGMTLEDRPIGGLGVHLVKSVIDHATYERHGTKNVVTLEKTLASSEAPDH
jgi:sigma-B regulation protein RsbU (phosphoserine phosphatase)